MFICLRVIITFEIPLIVWLTFVLLSLKNLAIYQDITETDECTHLQVFVLIPDMEYIFNHFV